MILTRKTYLRGQALVNNRNELVKITVDGTGGNWKFIYGGQTSANIAFDATAAQVKTAIELLSSVDADDILVSGGPGDNGGTTPYFFAFANEIDETAITTSDTLTGGASTAVVAVIVTGGGLRSIKYSHVPVGPTRSQAITLITFFNKRGVKIEADPVLVDNQDATDSILVNINRGSSTPTLTDYDIRVRPATILDVSLGIIGVRNLSVLLSAGHKKSTELFTDTVWHLTAWDPTMHIYDT